MTTVIQVLIIAILILVGFFLAKKNVFTEKTGKELSYMLINFVTPALILNSFQIDYTPEKLSSLIITFVFGFLSYAIIILFSFLYCGKGEKEKIERLVITFSNAGFMGIPLIEGVFGSEGVFYASIMVIIFNIMFWSYGIAVVKGRFSKESFKQILFSPTIISVVIGIAMFIARIKLPEPFASVTSHLANMNTPVAMMVAGISISQSNIVAALKNRSLYKMLIGKLFLAPLIIALLFMPLPIDNMIKQVLVLQIACPSAAIIGISTLQYGGNSKLATEYFTVTTIFSMLSIPIVKALCDLIFL